MAKKKATTEKVVKTTVKKSPEIKPAKAPYFVNQETQITPVQVISDEQKAVTEIQPNTVLVDPSVEQSPIKEEPVVNHDIPDTDYSHDDELLNTKKEEKHHKEKKVKVEDIREPTRLGNGKEVNSNQIEDTAVSVNHPSPGHGIIPGHKNEWPR